MTIRFSDADLSTFEGRLDYFCKRFDVEKPKLAYDSNGAVFDDDLIDWCSVHGVSIDWLYLGDPTGLLGSFSKQYKDAA